MPNLPQNVLPTVQLNERLVPERRLPEVGIPGSAFVGRGLEHLGAGLQQYEKLQKIQQDATKDGEDTVKGTQAITDYAMKMDEAEQFAKQNSDPENHLASWRDQLVDAKRETEASFGHFNREKKTEFMQSLLRLHGTAERNVLRSQQERRLDRQVAEGAASIDRLVGFATRAQSPELRVTMLEHAGNVASELANTGAIKETQAHELMQRAREKLTTGRVAYFATGLNTELDDLQNEAFRNPLKAEDLVNRGQRKIRDAGSDWLPPEKVDEKLSQFKNSLYVGVIKSAIDENPNRAKAELKSGKYDDKLTQQSILALNGEADNEIERLQRKTEAERKETVRQIGKQVSDFKDAKMLGFDWAGNESKLAQAVRGTEHQAEFDNVQQASRVLGQFNKLAPVEQEVYLRSLSSQPMSGDGAKFAGTLQAAHERTKAGLKEDPITFAIKQRSVPGVGPLDLNNPVSLKERSIVAGIVENRYSLRETVSPLSDDESNQLRATLEKAPADQQVQIFRQLKQGLEDRQIKAVASQLARKADPVLVQAMGLSVEAPEASSRILRGREIMRDNKEIMPKGADLKTAQDRIASTLGEAYKANPAHYSAVADSAMSIYAFKSWQQRDLSGTIDTKRLEESMKEASGGVLQLGSFGSRYTVQAPRYGATEADFMDVLKRADYSKAKGMKAADIQKHGIFESIGDGRYLVKIGPGYVQSERGPFVLDLNLPARGASGATLGGAGSVLSGVGGR